MQITDNNSYHDYFIMCNQIFYFLSDLIIVNFKLCIYVSIVNLKCNPFEISWVRSDETKDFKPNSRTNLLRIQY